MKGTVKLILTLLVSMSAASVMAAPTEQSLSIKGSDTMVHLVTNWAEAYMDAHAEADVSVTGGGSGTGIAALINGTTQVAASSREMEAKEKDLAAKNGVATKEFVVARDGIAMIVNPKNPLTEITMDQIKDIYTGKVNNWKEIGGNDEKIQVLSRESSSGTYVFFQEHVLKKQDFASNVKLMPATSAIVQGVKDDSGSIGYVGLGYAEEAGASIKVLNVKKDATSAAVKPSQETVVNGSYAIARPLYLVAKTPESEATKAFVAFALSEAGRKITREAGYVTVN